MAELDALKKHWKYVIDGISEASVSAINSFLYANFIYGAEVRDLIDAKSTSHEKTNEMLKAVEKKINRTPAAFNKFLEALRNDSTYNDLANTLASTRDELAKALSRRPSTDHAVKNGGVGNSHNGRGGTSREESYSRDNGSREQTSESNNDDSEEQTSESSDDESEQEVVEQSRKRSQGTCKNGNKKRRLDSSKSGGYNPRPRAKKTNSRGRDEANRNSRRRPTGTSYSKNRNKKRMLVSSESGKSKPMLRTSKTSSRGREQAKRKSREGQTAPGITIQGAVGVVSTGSGTIYAENMHLTSNEFTESKKMGELLDVVNICEKIAKSPDIITHLSDILFRKKFIAVDTQQAVKHTPGLSPYDRASRMIGPAIDTAEHSQPHTLELIEILKKFNLL